jgi:hypothetical protein
MTKSRKVKKPCVNSVFKVIRLIHLVGSTLFLVLLSWDKKAFSNFQTQQISKTPMRVIPSSQNQTKNYKMSRESVRKTVFSKTVLQNLEQSLTSVYGYEKATLIFDRATSILNNELNTMDDRGNKVVRKHISAFILPGFASYKALKESGIHSDEALDFVRKELNRTALREGKFMNKFQNVPFAYELLRLFVKPIIKFGFPKEGWTVTWKENSSNRISFDMISCLYCEELKNRNAFELCPAFCETDHVSYDPLAPKIVFKRTSTLAQPGIKACDFCFEKGV